MNGVFTPSGPARDLVLVATYEAEILRFHLGMTDRNNHHTKSRSNREHPAYRAAHSPTRNPQLETLNVI